MVDCQVAVTDTHYICQPSFEPQAQARDERPDGGGPRC